MRRFLAILLLGVINFSLATPAVSAQTGPQLPPCCRLSGKHKCALKRVTRQQKAGALVSTIEERCPFTAATGATGLSLHAFLLSGSRAFLENEPVVSAPQIYFQRIIRTAFDRAHYKRGPPHLLA